MANHRTIEMNVRRAYRFAKAAIIAYKMAPNDLENFDNFQSALQERRGGGLVDKYVRETYDQWRRENIKNELMHANFMDLAVPLLLEKQRLISLLAAIAIALSMIYPPFHITQGGTTYHLGFQYIFGPHTGDIDSTMLLCELAASWLGWRFLTASVTENK